MKGLRSINHKKEERKMNKKELKDKIEATGSYFFTRNTMKFFGDTMKNYGVRTKSVKVETYTQGLVDCWELYRIHPVRHGLQDSAYFHKETFERIHSKV
jgi:hypothetical protein